MTAKQDGGFLRDDTTGALLVSGQTQLLSGGYAERTSDTAALGPTSTAIPGLSFTVTPDTSQVLLLLHLPRVSKDTTAGFINPIIADTTGVTFYNQAIKTMTASSFDSVTVFALVTGLTPGASFTAKAFITCGGGGGAVTINGAATLRPFLAAFRM